MKKLIKWISLALAATSCAMFAACTPSSLEKAKERMAKEGYKVDMIEELLPNNCVGGIYAIDSDIDTIRAFLFESADDAKAFVEKKTTAAVFILEKSTPIQDGKWVYAGSEDAIEDFTEGLF